MSISMGMTNNICCNGSPATVAARCTQAPVTARSHITKHHR